MTQTLPLPRRHSGAHAPTLLLITGTAAIGGFLFGFDTAVINGAVLALKGHFNAGAWMIGLAVSMALLGSALGAMLAGPLADRQGRVRTMIACSALFTLSAIGSGWPVTIYDFIVWRLLGGVAVGAASVIAPAYIAEVSPAEWRGRLGSLQQLAIVTGIFVALMTSYFIASAAGGAAEVWLAGVEAWRWMFWSEIPAALLYGLLATRIPESPRYLAARGRDADAATVFRRIDPSMDAEAKVREIHRSLGAEHKPRLADITGRLGLLPIVWVGIGLSVLQQFVGINVIFYYSNTLWQSVGFTESDALVISVITSVINVLTTLIAIATVDKLGRKPLLLAGSIGMFVTLAAVAWAFGTAGVDANGQPSLQGSRAVVALIAANAYVFCFGFSWGPVVWVLLGEMFNNQIRAAALSVAAGMQWIANFAVSTTFPPMASNLGLGWSYAVYAAMAFVSIFFVLTLIPETKGRELEEM